MEEAGKYLDLSFSQAGRGGDGTPVTTITITITMEAMARL